MITQGQLNQLKEYFSQRPVDVVYLFGSQATEKANKLSDVDVGVLFSEGLDEGKRFDLRVRMAGDLPGIFKVEQVDVVDLDKAPLKFKYQIIAPKKVILSKNRQRMIEMEHHFVHSYLDFQPYLYNIAKRQLGLMAERGFAR